jgi:hypothetical protein
LCDLNIIIRIECILLKFHWGMKVLIELHLQHKALLRFIENVLRSTLSYPNETSKECIQFLIQDCSEKSILTKQINDSIYLMPIEQFFSYINLRSSYFVMKCWWYLFILDQHTELDFFSPKTMIQQSTDKRVAPLWYIILILSQSVFSLTP